MGRGVFASRRFTSGQPQAREEKRAVLRVSVWGKSRHHNGRDHPRPVNDLSRLVEPPHLRVTGGKCAIRVRGARIFQSAASNLPHQRPKSQRDGG